MNSCTTIIPYTPPLAPEEFIRREIERTQASSSVDSRSLVLSKENKAFLIEGGQYDSVITQYPELSLAKELANLNQISLMDCMHSYDQLHLSTFLASHSMRDHKKIVVYILKFLCRKDEIAVIVDKIIRPTFIILARQSMYTKVPEWLDTLKDISNLLESAQEIEDTFISPDAMQADYEEIIEKLFNMSNQVSAASFLNYLQEHPKIREVYGMMGIGRIGFLDEHALRIEAIISNDERHLQIKILDQTVDIHLFGGMFGDSVRYEKLLDFVTKRGLSVPEKPRETEIDTFCTTSQLTLLASHSSSRAGELAHRKTEERKSRLNEVAQRFD